MEPFIKQFEISDLYVDCFGKLKLSAVLFLAQEVAGHHCKELGLDWDTLAQKKMFWAVVRTNVCINRLPRRGETVTVRTWPMPTTRTAYPRAMELLDGQGNLLLRSISLWVLMDLENRTMLLPGKSGITVDGMLLGGELPAPRNIAPKALNQGRSRTVLFSDLDRNGHMNNTRYLDWATDLLDTAFHGSHEAREFSVCYITESREGQTLDLHWELENEMLHLDGSRNGERVFAVRIQYQ